MPTTNLTSPTVSSTASPTNPASLYRSSFEHDSCGVGGVINIKGDKTHSTVDDALKIVEKLEHRAGKDASGETGDGVGILLQISHRFFSAVAEEAGLEIGGEREYGVGMFFFPEDEATRGQRKRLFEVLLEKEGLEFIGWRIVPTAPQILGETARDCMPSIYQCFVRKPDDAPTALDFDRRLYVVRREFEQSVSDTYVASLSSRTIVYKGMFLVDQLRFFYADLQDARYESALALVHSRFSTNTNPSWRRAHPNRLILHNGEINTIRGNIDRMVAREETLHSPLLEQDMERVLPVVNPEGSDSAMLDNALEFLMFAGIELPKAVMMLIPEPWSRNTNSSRAKRDMYHYYATMMEPWDGPAAILFSDGDVVGAVLDRNGLRPVRYYLTDDDSLILSSEVGVLDIDDARIVRKSRLEPGKMLLVDTRTGEFKEDRTIKDAYAHENPYGEWLDGELVTLESLPAPKRRTQGYPQTTRNRLYKAFGYTYEDIISTILPMASTGAEPTAAMGVDIPLAVLSERHQPLFNYFKQMFAQVTNPPIDSIREEIVTDTTVYVGSDGNLLKDCAKNCRLLQIDNPILTTSDLERIKALDMPDLKASTVSLLYYENTPLAAALHKMFVAVDKAYHNGTNIIILSDRGVDENHLAIPSLLAVSALEQHLIRTKKRTAVSVILESAEPRCVHHFATLLGYGARAVNPYLAQECITELVEQDLLDRDPHTAIETYDEAVLDGVVRISAKMGISALQSYQSAQIFEAVGICTEVIDAYFTNTVSRIGGIGLTEIEEAVVWRHRRAFDSMGLAGDPSIDSVGFHRLRSGGGAEDHLYNPLTILSLQHAVRDDDYGQFKHYSALVDDERVPHTLRGLLEFAFDRSEAIPLEEVEPVEHIIKRFKTGAMSYGSISQEAHECLAIAMNSLGGKSNSGEGGEDPARLGTQRNSAIKQVASGRFGVTSEYLVSAAEIQIKMAQGAKPGEGGHLPGGKVWPWIARTRYATPGVSLISPPPHHDIYSIEDLAELIYDLKNANKDAAIAVKLVSEAGVGTIAAGVAKAGAQTVLVSGYDGGTGAAPHNSLSGAGLPWELGVAEAHQTLMLNGLRSRVKIEADGKLMTGRDVAIACILGAEEFGFATAPLVALGCTMMRVCNLDTCPMGIATQNPELRKNFRGKPEYVVSFMRFVAEEVREILARFGLRSMDELVGRTDLLRMRPKQISKRAAMVDVSAILASPTDARVRFDPEDLYDFALGETLDETMLLKLLEADTGAAGSTEETVVDAGGSGDVAEAKPTADVECDEGSGDAASAATQPADTSPTAVLNVTSANRAVGSLFGAELTRRFGTTLEPDTYHIHCKGGAGQSFGAFIPRGLTLELEGDGNDYFGKGLSGGRLIVYPPLTSTFAAAENVIIGNVALYGATSGSAFINGIAGERFCVRNSGANAVVEGIGDHGCEYMTGGCVVVLGRTGRNFAAGMSGGVAYVLDTQHDLYLRTNKELVSIEQLLAPEDIATVRTLITEHVRTTGSPRGAEILADFDQHLADFKKIIPYAYSDVLERIAFHKEQGMDDEEAATATFLERGE